MQMNDYMEQQILNEPQNAYNIITGQARKFQ